MEKIYEVSSVKLKKAMVAAEVSPVLLANKSDVPASAIACAMKGGSKFDANTLEKMAATLGVNPADLIVFGE